MKAIWFTALGAICVLAGCQNPNQNRYAANEVGKSSAISFASVLAVREVDIIGKNSGVGAMAGGIAGTAAGAQFGQGRGSGAAAIAGLLIGAAAGALAEQGMNDRKGLEYTLMLETGIALTITQEMPGPDEKAFALGERVIVQNTGGYQRVLPVGNLPSEVKRPQGIKVVE